MDLRGEEPKEQVFKYDGGIRSFVESINKAKTPIHDGVIYIKKELPKVSVEVAFQYNDGYSDNTMCFANYVNTIDGGTHLTGFRSH